MGTVTSDWSGSTVREARAWWTPIVNAGGIDCRRCGLPILPGSRWHVGHIVDRALGGGRLDWRVNTAPEHGSCNESAGGKLGQALRGHRAGPKRDGRRRTVLPAVPDVQRRSWK